MNAYQKICKTLPANKLHAPRLNHDQRLFHKEILGKKEISPQSDLPKILFLEAQAGQGKTTLALQWLQQENSTPYTWYQVGPEDQDPILFFAGLLAAIAKIKPFLQSSPLLEMIGNGELGGLELPACIDTLFQELREGKPADDFVLVLDDLHLIENSPHSLAFLDILLQKSPFFLQFVLISRKALEMQALSHRSGLEVIRLTNKDLALSSMETMELLHDIMKIPIDWNTARQLHKRTEGWLMGTILAGQLFQSDEDQLKLLSPDNLEEYFQREILTHIPNKQKNTLLKLSFLDEIDPVLARKITGEFDIAEILQDFSLSNFFIQRRGKENELFSFHHLFQDFLQGVARVELHPGVINTILEQAALFCQEHRRVGRCLNYYLNAGNIEAMETVLQEDGMELLANNRNMTIISILNRIPEEIMAKSLWLRLYIGLACFDTDPIATLPLVHTLMEEFAEANDTVGELLAGSQILAAHFIYTSMYEEGSAILPRMKALFHQTEEILPLHSRITVAKNLAMSSVIMAGEIEEAATFSDLALRLSKQHNIKNYVAATLLSKGYEHLLAGRCKEVHNTAENAYAHINHASVSLINRCSLLTFLHNVCDSMGDEDNCKYYKSFIIYSFGKEALSQTLVGPSLLIWDIGLAVGKGRLEEAEQILNQANESGVSAFTPHIHSQFLHWQAYLAAHAGDMDGVLQTSAKSVAMRNISGSPFFIILNKIILGSSHTLIKNYDQAAEYLTQAVEMSQDHNSRMQESLSCLHRGFLFLQTCDEDEAREDIRNSLELMRKNNYRYFLSWSPTIMKPVLQFAVDNDIEKEYARLLAKDRMQLFLKKNAVPIPQLKISLFGGMQLEIGGKTICQSSDLTPAWRQILSILILSDKQCVSNGAMRSTLWPEKSSDKARSALDTQLSRLRKFLKTKCNPHPLDNYFKSSKGIITLSNYSVDVLDYLSLGEKGLTHMQNLEWWQAGNDFYTASRLWQKGRFDSELSGCEQAYLTNNRLNNLFVKTTLAWGKHLQETNRKQEALELLEKAVAHDPSRMETVLALFHFHLEDNNISQARNTLDQFDQSLQFKNYSSDEIKQMKEEILLLAELE